MYIAWRGADPVYVGITKRTKDVRLREHNRRGTNFTRLDQIAPRTSRVLALGIETIIIIQNPHLENRIQSIANSNPIFSTAINAAANFVRQHSIRTRW